MTARWVIARGSSSITLHPTINATARVFGDVLLRGHIPGFMVRQAIRYKGITPWTPNTIGDRVHLATQILPYRQSSRWPALKDPREGAMYPCVRTPTHGVSPYGFPAV
jgi:hypothetical protein